MNRIYLSQPEFSDDLLQRIEIFLKDPDLSGSSASILEFEGKLGQITGSTNVIGLSSGTAAIHLALQLVGVKSGDYVACQSFTFCATANPIKYVGATPVFIDSEMNTWNMCPNTLCEYLLDAKRENILPKAIIYVHAYGMPAKVSELMEIAKEYNIPLIEDAAESIGSRVNGKPTGQFGALSIFSFNGNKIASTSGGGALLSNDKKLIDRAFYLSTQARKNENFEHDEIGYNYRIGAVNALIGAVQLTHLDKYVGKRRARYNNYYNELNDVKEIEWQVEAEGSYANRWITTLLINNDKHPEEIIRNLKKENVELRKLWKPLHLQQSFSGSMFVGSGNCTKLWKRGLCLPSGKFEKDTDLDKVVEQLLKHI